MTANTPLSAGCWERAEQAVEGHNAAITAYNIALQAKALGRHDRARTWLQRAKDALETTP